MKPGDEFDPTYEMVKSDLRGAPLKTRVLSALARNLYSAARWCEEKSFRVVFSSTYPPVRAVPTPDLIRVQQVEAAVRNPELREAMIRGAVAPRRTEAEQLELIKMNSKPVNVETFEWAGSQGNAGNTENDNVMGGSEE